MENQEAKNLLLNLEQEIATPKTTPQAAILSAHPKLVNALRAALAREDALLKAAAKGESAIITGPAQPIIQEPEESQHKTLREKIHDKFSKG